jgi:hypothetical protein
MMVISEKNNISRFRYTLCDQEWTSEDVLARSTMHTADPLMPGAVSDLYSARYNSRSGRLKKPASRLRRRLVDMNIRIVAELRYEGWIEVT